MFKHQKEIPSKIWFSTSILRSSTFGFVHQHENLDDLHRPDAGVSIPGEAQQRAQPTFGGTSFPAAGYVVPHQNGADKVWTKIILGCTAWCPNGTMTWPSKWDSWEVEMVTPIASHSCIQIFKAGWSQKTPRGDWWTLQGLNSWSFPVYLMIFHRKSSNQWVFGEDCWLRVFFGDTKLKLPTYPKAYICCICQEYPTIRTIQQDH